MNKRLRRLSGLDAIDRYLRRHYTGLDRPEKFPRGHFYSPLPDIDAVRSHKDRLYNPAIDLSASIDLRAGDQRALLKRLAAFYEAFPYDDTDAASTSGHRFSFDQVYFKEADALMLYALLRYVRPRRVVEVGSGHSSALMLDTNDGFLGGRAGFTFIEPFPDRLRSILRPGDEARVTILEKQVQHVPVDIFRQLDENDMLFVDSSHVSKAGSDVNHLLFQILPALAPGVWIHFHDIFWPFEYPLKWIEKGRAWNEAYLLRAFLQYNDQFEVMLFNSYAGHAFADFIAVQMPLFLRNTGGSLWLRKR